jgi:hypothetical protein
VQTGPGTYTADFDAKAPGNYVVVLSYPGANGAKGVLPSGMSVNTSPELRDLHSNESVLQQIAERTGGKVFKPFEPITPELFSRDGLKITASPLPIWDLLIPVLLGLILVDVATRRIAWDWLSMKKMAAAAAAQVRGFTVIPKVESRQTLDALRRVREDVAETTKPGEESRAAPPGQPAPRPDRAAKFEAGKGVEGDISQVVGGATEKPIPSAPKKPQPMGDQPEAPGSHTGSLLEAKRRARQQIEEKERGE